MSKYLLFELGVEEMPACQVGDILSQFKNNLSKYLRENRIEFENVKAYATPRRLTLVVEGIDQRQKDLQEEVKGPSKKISLDLDANFTKPALGFMRSKNIDEKDVYFKEVGKEEYLFAKIKNKGLETSEILKSVLPNTIRSIVFSKSMRWGGKNLKFVRPIRWIVALLNDKVIEFDIEGIVSSNITKGHRFLGKNEIIVNSISDYYNKLEENYVILDQDKRCKIILDQFHKLELELNGTIEKDIELLNEVTYLVEYPTAFYGEYSKEYTHLPKEVVITPMKQHQRYFPVTRDDKLIPYFVAVRNGDDYKIKNVKLGNEKVLEARLADAKFFYNEDIKHSLEEYVEKLKNVVFQEKLGTVYEKSIRIGKLGNTILNKLNKSEYKDLVSRAAKLAKADLVTGMVGEFDELQGYMGKEYASVYGENPEVCQAIYEHYLPRFSGDKLPESVTGMVLSIADKLDSIAGFFAIGIQPTGSQDPFGLRRQAIGILNILLEQKTELNLESSIFMALDNYSDIEFVKERERVLEDIMAFIADRLKVLFKDMGIRYDVVDAVLNAKVESVYDMYCRADALNNWIDRDELVELLTAFNRVSTLAQKTQSNIIDEGLFYKDEEKTLYRKFNNIERDVKEFIYNKKYVEALDTFTKLKPFVDNLFDNVMIMDKDENIKNNRLALLRKIYDTMLTICDLSKLVYK